MKYIMNCSFQYGNNDFAGPIMQDEDGVFLFKNTLNDIDLHFTFTKDNNNNWFAVSNPLYNEYAKTVGFILDHIS